MKESHTDSKLSKYNKIMKEQANISLENLKNKVGKKYRVLVENLSFDGRYFVGRTMQDVPEEDGLVYIKNAGDVKIEDVLNNFVECEIVSVNDYDLIGKLVI